MSHRDERRDEQYAVKQLSILYIGVDSGTSLHRVRALERLGHRVTLVNPRTSLPRNKLVARWVNRTGGLFFEQRVRKNLLATLPLTSFDVVWVDAGDLIGPSLVKDLKALYGCVVNYNHDDPYGKRDGYKWRLYLKAVPEYNLITVIRECNVKEALAAGAKDVLLLDRSADEVAHAPRKITKEDYEKWSSEVVFIGTWMPERGPFMVRLLELGVPLTIYGYAWQKAKEWPLLQEHWRGPGLYDDESYAKAVQCAKVCLGLLSKGNRDEATTRSFEVPYLGGVLCAERTSEHSRLYLEDVEAVFWSTPEECAEKCMRLLGDEEWRKLLSKNGRARCIRNRTTHQEMLREILNRALHQPRADKEEVYSFMKVRAEDYS